MLLGILGPDSRVKHLAPVIPVSALFVRQAETRGNPEMRFRFAEPCAAAQCANWDNHQCGLIDRLIEESGSSAPCQSHLPICGIRDTCRWHAQRGGRACALCPDVMRRSPDDATRD